MSKWLKKVVNLMKTEQTTNRIAKRIAIIFVIIFAIFFMCIIGVAGYFFYTLAPVDKNSGEEITFVLARGWGTNKVADELERQGLIKNALTFKIYLKANSKVNFQAGSYSLSKNMSVDEIIEIFKNGKNTIQDTISITFVEGKKIPYYAKKISESFPYSEEEVLAKMSNQDYLKKLIKDYWFMDDAVLSPNLYYPLEGYLFPDTYEFERDATLEGIIKKMLDQLDSKLTTYKEEINLTNKSIHNLLTLASMVELEAVTPDDRLETAGVFKNRLNTKMTLGSDVTTYYGVKKEMSESLYMSEINACNAYNTRGTCAINGLPIGPICNPSLSSIVAAVNPNETENYYFVADRNNKVYFSKTYAEQNQVINNLKKQGLWAE